MRSLPCTLAAAATMLALAAPAVQAQQRAFVVEGTESQLGDSPWAGVADIDVLPDGDVVRLATDGYVTRAERSGRRIRITRIGTPLDAMQDVDAAPDGTIVAVVDGRAWRADGNPADPVAGGPATALTPRVEYESPEAVNAAAPLPGGGLLLARHRRITRLAPDGTETPVAGSGARGAPRPGRAVGSPLTYVEEVSPTSAGGVLFADAGAIWHVRPDGMLERFAAFGGSDDDGARITTVEGDPAAEILVVASHGVYSIRGGGVREVIDASVESAAPPRAPLWNGGPARRAWLHVSGGAARTPGGGWVFGTSDGFVVLTDAQGRSEHAAIAVTTPTLASAARGTIQVAATRRMTAYIEVRSHNRLFTTVTAPVGPGTTTLRLRRPLPPGVVYLEAQGITETGVARPHRLAVLGTRLLPVGVARQALALEARANGLYGNPGPCRRIRPTTVTCLAELVDEDNEGEGRKRYTLSLRPDGWVWLSSPGEPPQRVELREPYRQRIN